MYPEAFKGTGVTVLAAVVISSIRMDLNRSARQHARTDYAVWREVNGADCQGDGLYGRSFKVTVPLVYST